MVELFARGDVRPTFEAHKKKLSEEIEKFSDEKILGADFNEWTNYFFDTYKIQPICLFLDNTSQTMSETKVERNHPFYRRNPYEPQICYVDGYKITYTIPFDGDSSLFFLRPSRYYLSSFFVDTIRNGTDSACGNIVFSLEYTKQELEGKDDLRQFIDSQFSSRFNSYKSTIDSINEDVCQLNEALPEIIANALVRRKSKVDDFIAMSEKLSIPLTLNPNAPNTTPIPLERALSKKPGMPSMRPREKNHVIDSGHYDNIRRIIYTAGTSMEGTASTHSRFNEEELRDSILSTLNSHYSNTATGETFRKTGKTDICIPFENKSAYVAECKIWHGEKKLQGAIDQLMQYITWRDARNSILIFNKENKDFGRILETINSFLQSNACCIKREHHNSNEWHCVFKKTEDALDSVEIQFVAFDLCIK